LRIGLRYAGDVPSISYVVYVNPRRRKGVDLEEPYARVHTTRCGEWTEGRHEYPGGYWLGPYDSLTEATDVAEESGHRVVICNYARRLIHGKELGRMVGPKARDLFSRDLGSCELREIYVHPGVDVLLERGLYGDILLLHSYMILVSLNRVE
jgi:hypothetical protein